MNALQTIKRTFTGSKTKIMLKPNATAEFYDQPAEEVGSEIIYRVSAAFSDGDVDRAERRVNADEDHELGPHGQMEIIDQLRRSLLTRRAARLMTAGVIDVPAAAKPATTDPRSRTTTPHGVVVIGASWPADAPPAVERTPSQLARRDAWEKSFRSNLSILCPEPTPIKSRSPIGRDHEPSFVHHVFPDNSGSIRLCVRLVVNGVLIDSETVPLLTRSPYDITRAESPATEDTRHECTSAHLDEQVDRLKSLLIARNKSPKGNQ